MIANGETRTAWTSGGRFDPGFPARRGSWKPGPPRWLQETEGSNWKRGLTLPSERIGSKRARRNEFKSVSVQTSPHDLEEDAASAPHVHLKAVVAVGQEALWGSVPAGGDVFRVRGLGVNAPTWAEVAQLQAVLLQRSM